MNVTRDKRASEVRRGRGRPSSSSHTPTWTTRSRYLGAEDVSGSPRVRSQLPGKCLSDTAADTGRVQLTTHDPPQLGDRPQQGGMTTSVQGPRVLVSLASPLLCTKEPGLLFSASQPVCPMCGAPYTHTGPGGENTDLPRPHRASSQPP